MQGLSIKYLLKRGAKKTSENIFRTIISVLLLAASAILFAYSEMFFLFDVVAVQSRFVENLNEDDFKYLQIYSDGELYSPLPNKVLSYLDEQVPYIKYTRFTMNAINEFGYGGYFGLSFCIITSAADLLSYGYSFYGNYAKTLSDGEIYISDTYLKEFGFYLSENGEFVKQTYEDNTDTSEEWFSSFVGKEIYIEKMESAKVKIVGVVNTGYYSLAFSDAGIEGIDNLGYNLEERRESALRECQLEAIGTKIFCTEDFLREYIVKEGSVTIGSAFEQCGGVTIREDFSVEISGENASYAADGKKIEVANTVSEMYAPRQYLHQYADDKGIHYPNSLAYYSGASLPEVKVDVNLYGITRYRNEYVTENDVCGEGEIMLSSTLYKKLYGEENYDFNKKLPSHIGEKINVTITVDGKMYEIKDKTLVGVTEFSGYISVDDGFYGIICREDETVNELMSDYITMHYIASINISGMSESELSSVLHTLKNKYGVVANLYNTKLNYETESVEQVKSIYFAISLGFLLISVLFEGWTVLHTVKRDYREIGILRANGVTAGNMTVIYGVQFFIIGILTFALSLIGLNILAISYETSNLQLLMLISYFPELELYWVGASNVLSLVALNLIVPLITSLFAFFKVRKISPVEAINEAKRNE